MKTKLDVPFRDKDRAKGLGARWDYVGKTWYCPDGVDLALFKEWVGSELREWFETEPISKPSEFRIESAGIITGSLYKPSGDCAGCCEPWEVCDWPCPDAIGEPNSHDRPYTA